MLIRIQILQCITSSIHLACLQPSYLRTTIISPLVLLCQSQESRENENSGGENFLQGNSEYFWRVTYTCCLVKETTVSQRLKRCRKWSSERFCDLPQVTLQDGSQARALRTADSTHPRSSLGAVSQLPSSPWFWSHLVPPAWSSGVYFLYICSVCP